MQDILKSDEFKDVVIIAADQFVWGNSTTGKQTSADALRGKDDNIKYDKSEKKMRGNLGHWNIFYGGEKIRSVSGDWQPSYIPKSIIELIKSSNEINNKE